MQQTTGIHETGSGYTPRIFLIREPKRTAIPMSEREFSRYWQYQVIEGADMYTETGEPLKVLYPGRPNDIQGADFRDAVVISGDETLTGNVELHLKSGDWRNHGHHLDPRYNNVVLHVVRNHNSKQGTKLQNGAEIPVLELQRYMTGQAGAVVPSEPEHITGIPCSGIGESPNRDLVLDRIESAGTVRFLKKVQELQQEAETDGAEETLYREFMTALGYSGNKKPFRELAVKLPLQELEAERQQTASAETYLLTAQALLLGAAGFLTPESGRLAERSGLSPDLLEQIRFTWSVSGREALIPLERWQLCMIRPQNSPMRRLAAMAYILHRYRKTGLTAALSEVLANSVRSGNRRDLKDSLEVGIPDAARPGKNVTLLGASRTGAITINVLLPWIFAETIGGPDREQILLYYRSLPKPGENSLEKHMVMQLGLNRKDVNTALRQQGLIFIYKEFCTQGKCGACPLGKLESGQYIEGEIADLS